MTVKKFLKINISFILIIALLLQVCPVISFAETLSTSVIEFDDASAIIDSQSEPAVYILGEIENKREKNVKYFRQSDGTIYAAVYNDPIHFEQDGIMVEIDNTLVSTQIDSKNYFRNKTNDVSFTVPEILNENSEVIISKGDRELRMSLLSSLQSTIQIAEPPVVTASTAEELRSFVKSSEKQLMTATANTTATLKSKEDKEKAILETVKEIEKLELTVENISSTLSYNNVFLNTNIQYDLQGGQLKESIVLSAYNGVSSYQYFIKVSGLSAELLEDKSVAFYDEKTDEAVFYIMAPYMWDAADVYSDDIAVSLTSQEGGYLYTIEPSQEWLTSEDRQYPVTIDPTIEQYGGDITKDTVACPIDLGSYYSTLNSSSERNILKVGKRNGYELMTLMYTPLPSEISSSSRLVKAQICLNGYKTDSPTCKSVMCINAYMIDTDWDVASVGSTDVVLHGSQVPQYVDRVLDFFHCQETATGFDTNPHTVDITWAAQQWVEGCHANYGIALCDSTPNTQPNNNYARFYDSRHSGNYDPVFKFEYRDTKGLESYWSYTSMTAGRYGSVSVNNFNGNAVIIQQDYGIDGNRMPVSISHVFNASNTSQAVYGGKWRLNYQITISEYGVDGYPYYLTDGDGTEHCFYQVSSNELRDEDGLGYTLTVDSSSSTARYTITDKNNGKMIFNSSGKLTQLKDASGNTATIAYSTGNISSITDGAGRVYTFTYSNGQLASITAPDSKKITYTYSGGNLTKITYPDNKSTTFAYESETDHDIMRVVDPDGKKTVISIKKTAPIRVIDIERKTADNATIDKYSFVYQHNATDITDKDNRKYTYQFNNFGQTMGILNHQGNIAQNYVYGEPGIDGIDENKLLGSSDVQKTVVNMLHNSDFSISLGSEYSAWIAEGQVYSYGWSVEKEHRPNSNYSSLKIHRTDMGTANAIHTFVYQEKVAPVDGYYTFSAYVCLDGVQLMGGGALVRIERIDTDGTNHGGSQQSIMYTGVDKWERLSTTYYFNAGDTIRCMMGINDFTTMTPIWYDDIQLEYGEVANSYTLVENADFSAGTSLWRNTDVCQLVNITDADRPQNISKGIAISGGYQERSVVQTVAGDGSIGHVFSVGGWAKAESVNTDYTRNQGPFFVVPTFCIAVSFWDSGNLIRTERVPFNHAYDGWQFASKEIIAPVNYMWIEIELEYDYNANTAIFTLPYITEETYGQSYTYDENGNVISSKEKTKAETNFAYTNDQLSKLLNPSGSNYNYTFDSETLLPTYAVSSDGVMEEITYDSAGNPLSATTWSMKPVNQITSGKSYVLVNAKTGKALDANGTAIRTIVVGKGFEKGNAYQKWTITSTSDGHYNLSVTPTSTSGTFRLDIPDGANTEGLRIILHNANTSAAQKYKLQANADGTFSLLTAVSNYTKCVDAQPDDEEDMGDGVGVKQCTYVEGDKAQKWYLYEADIAASNTAHIQSSATYTSDKNYISTVTDALGNTSTYNYNTTSGLLTSMVDPRNNTTNYTYDEMNRVKTVSAGGMTASYTYLNDYLTGISIAEGTNYTFTYDDYGRASATKVGNTTLATYTYNDRHLVIRQDYGNGDDFITFSYDDLDRLTEKAYNGSSVYKINYYYDAQGRLGKTIDSGEKLETLYIYDLSGRLVECRVIDLDSTVDAPYHYAIKHTYANGTDYITSTSYYTYNSNTVQNYTYGDVDEGTMPDVVYEVKSGNTTQLTYTFDELARLSTRTINPINKTQTYTYYPNHSTASSKDTSTLVNSLVSDGVNWSYDYDSNGNITFVYRNGFFYESYAYDSLNQLSSYTTANGDRYEYTYKNGNILTVTKNGVVEKTYGYNDANWPDKLTSFNGRSINYHYGTGNPSHYYDYKFLNWSRGRQLTLVGINADTYYYTYDSNGNRVAKKKNSEVIAEFHMVDGVILEQTVGSDTLSYYYDEAGRKLGFRLNDSADYYYEYNLQGDVIGIFDSTGTKIVTYTYDPWGKLLSTEGSAAETIGLMNPIRYRGYYYDTETGFYYLQTRYYDPETGRFISPDGEIASIGGDVQGYNFFAYCFNNPVNMGDSTGQWPKWLSGALNIARGALEVAAGAILGAAVGWTGIGAVAAGVLVADGAATITQGSAQIINDIAKTKVLHEDNIIKTVVQETGEIVGGETGGKVAAAAYDVTVTAASLYAGKVSMQQGGVLRKNVPVNRLINNPSDPFVKTGPKNGCITQYCNSIPTQGYGSITVRELSLRKGYYMILDGHHRVAAIRSLGNPQTIKVYLE